MARIQDVWASNLDDEMRKLRDVVEKYPYVALDTEFPGVVARPIGSFKTSSDHHYQTMRCNVDLLKIIQIGLTLCDEEGRYPDGVCTWQFNFHFSVSNDTYASDSLEPLHEAGFDFARHEQMGIAPKDFAELLITSGLVLFEDVTWVSFHSGYDFGYLMKLLTNAPLPSSEEEFFKLLRTWFPTVFDVKFMIQACKPLKGVLQDVADDLGVIRIDPSRQTGSDSLLTAAVFFKIREVYFNDHVDNVEYNGKLYGLGRTMPSNNGHLTLSGPSVGLDLRSGATIAERDRTRLSRESTNAQGQAIQSNQHHQLVPNQTGGMSLGYPNQAALSYGVVR